MLLSDYQECDVRIETLQLRWRTFCHSISDRTCARCQAICHLANDPKVPQTSASATWCMLCQEERRSPKSLALSRFRTWLHFRPTSALLSQKPSPKPSPASRKRDDMLDCTQLSAVVQRPLEILYCTLHMNSYLVLTGETERLRSENLENRKGGLASM